MVLNEIPQPVPYQQLVRDQIRRYQDATEGIYNVVGRGVYNLEKETGESPLWALSFDQKPTRVDREHHFSLRIEDENQLRELHIPRQYSALVVEREQIVDEFGQEAIIERVYEIGTDSAGEEIREIGYIAQYAANWWRKRRDPREWFITVQMPDLPEIRATVLKEEPVQVLLTSVVLLTSGIEYEVPPFYMHNRVFRQPFPIGFGLRIKVEE